MPYIMEQDRIKFYETLFNLPIIRTPGELNYLVTAICKEYAKYSNESSDVYAARYQAHNDIIGALEGCKLEFYRRFTAKYEDIKIRANGEV